MNTGELQSQERKAAVFARHDCKIMIVVFFSKQMRTQRHSAVSSVPSRDAATTQVPCGFSFGSAIRARLCGPSWKQK